VWSDVSAWEVQHKVGLAREPGDAERFARAAMKAPVVGQAKARTRLTVER
jgi:hypothetical protein